MEYFLIQIKRFYLKDVFFERQKLLWNKAFAQNPVCEESLISARPLTSSDWTFIQGLTRWCGQIHKQGRRADAERRFELSKDPHTTTLKSLTTCRYVRSISFTIKVFFQFCCILFYTGAAWFIHVQLLFFSPPNLHWLSHKHSIVWQKGSWGGGIVEKKV